MSADDLFRAFEALPADEQIRFRQLLGDHDAEEASIAESISQDLARRWLSAQGELFEVKEKRTKPKKGTKERMQQIHALRGQDVPWKTVFRKVGHYKSQASMEQTYGRKLKSNPEWFEG